MKKRPTKKRAASRKSKRSATRKRYPAGGGTRTGRFSIGMDPPENRRELAQKMAARTSNLQAAGDAFASATKRYHRKVDSLVSAGMEVVYGQPTLLLVDVDDRGDLDKARELLGGFSKQLGVESVTERRSKSGNWHLHVRLTAPLERAERVLLQGLLGGDPVRAILDWLWVRQGHAEECFLAEVPFNRAIPFSFEEQDFGASYGL